MASKLRNINPNEAQRSMVAVDTEALSLMAVLTAATAVTYVVQTEAPFLLMVADKAFYYNEIGGTASISAGMRWPADLPLKIVSPSARTAHTGITSATTIIENSDTDKSDYEVAAMTWKVDGLAYTKVAEDNIAFGTAWTINTGAAATAFWGAVLIQITPAGVVSDKVVTADQVFATQAEAIDALPAADAGNIPIGYITINATSSDTFTANTESLNDGDTAVVAINFIALSTPSEVQRFMGPEQLGPLMDSHVGQVVSLDAPANDTLIYIAEVH